MRWRWRCGGSTWAHSGWPGAGPTLEGAGGFLAWLRTGDGPRVVSIERWAARFAESTIAARLHAVVSYYRYHQFNGVELGRDLVRLVHSRAAAISRCWSMPLAAAAGVGR